MDKDRILEEAKHDLKEMNTETFNLIIGILIGILASLWANAGFTLLGFIEKNVYVYLVLFILLTLLVIIIFSMLYVHYKKTKKYMQKINQVIAYIKTQKSFENKPPS